MYGYEQYCSQGEASLTKVEKVLQTGSQEFKYHGIVLPTGAKVVDLGYPHCQGLRRRKEGKVKAGECIRGQEGGCIRGRREGVLGAGGRVY